MMPYGSTVLEHFRRPRNHGGLTRPTVSREAENPLCGDRVRIDLAVEDGIIREAAFVANACAICTASASLLTERVAGVDGRAALAISDDEIIAALNASLPAGRIACALLPAVALRGALSGAATVT